MSYLIHWKQIWLHESLCSRFSDLIKDFWERSREKVCHKVTTPVVLDANVDESLSGKTEILKDVAEDFTREAVSGSVDDMSENKDPNDDDSMEMLFETALDYSSKRNRACIEKSLEMSNLTNTGTNSLVVEGQNTKQKEKKKVKCEICLKNYSSRNALREHKIMIHFKNGNFPCDICGKRFSHNRALRIHRVMHTKERDYKCPECNSTHKRANELKAHVKDMHSTIRNYRCDVCFQCFKTKSLLRTHCFEDHKNTETNCIVCKQYLRTPYSIYSHCLMHTQVKEYHCDICARLFTTKKLMFLHKSTHREDRQPFRICPKCGKPIYSKTVFYEHLRSHSKQTNELIRHPCTKCDATFKYTSTLRRHMLRHKPGGDLEFPKVNPYEDMPEDQLPPLCCKICRKNYTSKSGYYEHIRQCRDGYVKPKRQCSECGKEYAHKSALNRHVRKAHTLKQSLNMPEQNEPDHEIEVDDI